MNIRLKCSATEFNLFIIADSLVIQFGLRKHDSGGYIPTIQGSDDRNKALSLAAWTYGELQDRCLSTGQFKLMWSRQALLTALTLKRLQGRKCALQGKFAIIHDQITRHAIFVQFE